MRYWMVFDIETVPDADLGRHWLGLSSADEDADVRRKMLEARQTETGHSDFLKPPYHQVAAISAALIDGDGVIRRLGPLGDEAHTEGELLRQFFGVIEELQPRLVGWNTSGFDLPTLLYRAMRHRIPTPAFYRIGEPYHGYRKRYDEESHLDLMDILSGYGASARVSLHEMAMLLGFPGKLDVDGSQVMDLFEAGEVGRIRRYCSHDVMTTTLVFTEYAYHRGWMEAAVRDTLINSARKWIQEDPDVWAPFQDAWQALSREADPA